MQRQNDRVVAEFARFRRLTITVAEVARLQTIDRGILNSGEFSYEDSITVDTPEEKHDYLRRLDAANYRGRAYVHWSLTIEDRRTGWLIPVFYYKFRETLTHSLFRYGLACPIYCIMPDHIHLLWTGVFDSSDQLLGMRHFRKALNSSLEKLSARLQLQPYDHVLRDDERIESAFANVAEYIARNPERKGLVELDRYQEYPYTGCLVPGYPELKPFQHDFWERFWRIYSYWQREGMGRMGPHG